MALVHEADGPRARDAILKIAQRRARASAYTRRVAGEDVSTLGRLRPKRVQQAEHRCARVTNEGVQSQQIGSAEQDRRLGAWQGTTQQPITDRTETMLDWTSAVPLALLELTLKGWINVGFIALIVLIAAVAAILGRVPRRA